MAIMHKWFINVLCKKFILFDKMIMMVAFFERMKMASCSFSAKKTEKAIAIFG